jgi:hypothetical protein
MPQCTPGPVGRQSREDGFELHDVDVADKSDGRFMSLVCVLLKDCLKNADIWTGYRQKKRMADINSANQRATPADAQDKKAPFTTLSAALTAGVTVITLIGGAYKLGHDAGVSDGSIQFQAQVSDLRDKVASATTAATISQSNEATVRAQQKQWQDAYNKLLDTDKDLANENNSLTERMKQLDPCAYMEREIDALNASLRGMFADSVNANKTAAQRDSIQSQLSTCRH